jgi:hypothetical protein
MTLPDVSWPPLRGFWEAAARDELAIPRCAGCGAWNWYPRAACRSCGGAEMPWTPTAGRATLYSFAVVRRALFEPYAGLVPYATGLVALEEDPAVRLATRFVDCDPERLRIDQPVRAVFRPLELPGTPGSVPAPFFTPSENPNPTRPS